MVIIFWFPSDMRASFWCVPLVLHDRHFFYTLFFFFLAFFHLFFHNWSRCSVSVNGLIVRWKQQMVYTGTDAASPIFPRQTYLTEQMPVVLFLTASKMQGRRTYRGSARCPTADNYKFKWGSKKRLSWILIDNNNGNPATPAVRACLIQHDEEKLHNRVSNRHFSARQRPIPLD